MIVVSLDEFVRWFEEQTGEYHLDQVTSSDLLGDPMIQFGRNALMLPHDFDVTETAWTSYRSPANVAVFENDASIFQLLESDSETASYEEIIQRHSWPTNVDNFLNHKNRED